MSVTIPNSDEFSTAGTGAAASSNLQSQTFNDLIQALKQFPPNSMIAMLEKMNPNSPATQNIINALYSSAGPQMREALKAANLITTAENVNTQAREDSTGNDPSSRTDKENKTPQSNASVQVDGITFTAGMIDYAVALADKTFKHDLNARNVAAATTVVVAAKLQHAKLCKDQDACIAAAAPVVNGSILDQLKKDPSFRSHVTNGRMNEALNEIKLGRMEQDVAQIIARTNVGSGLQANANSLISIYKDGMQTEARGQADLKAALKVVQARAAARRPIRMLNATMSRDVRTDAPRVQVTARADVASPRRDASPRGPTTGDRSTSRILPATLRAPAPSFAPTYP